MISSATYIENNEAFIFELDDVLYPEKDYLLQVYYLFAQFIEYTEQQDASSIIQFMQETYRKEGTTDLFSKTARQFNLPEKYQSNFDLLHLTARLPLKLLLFAPVLKFIQQILAAGKPLFLLAGGDPLKQLNKIRQLEWNGAEQHLVVYFTEEIAKGSTDDAIDIIINKHGLNPSKTAFINNSEMEMKKAFSSGINSLPIGKLLVS